jgi:hypothetical protein
MRSCAPSRSAGSGVDAAAAMAAAIFWPLGDHQIRGCQMKIRVGYELIYDFPQSTPMIMVLGTHFTGRPTSSCPIT